MATTTEIAKAQKAVDSANAAYVAAVKKYTEANSWEKTFSNLKGEVTMAKQVLDEAQEIYMQTAAVSSVAPVKPGSALPTGSETALPENGIKNMLPFIIGGVVVVAIIIFIVIKKRRK